MGYLSGTSLNPVFAALALVLSIGGEDSAADENGVRLAIEKNAASISKFEQYYLHIVQEGPELMEPGARIVEDTEWKIWRSGIKYRRFERSFYAAVPDGVVRLPQPNGEVGDVSWDDKHVRNLRGWDPTNPFQLPLEFGRNAQEFESVSCGIVIRDPVARVNQVEVSALLWEFYPGWSLYDAARVATFAEIEGAAPGISRLRLDSTTEPTLAHAVGCVIDLDAEHDWMIRRVELPAAFVVKEVTEFARSESGLWIAREVRSMAAGKLSNRTIVREFSVNEPIAPDQLQTQFPKGARVRDSATGMFHIWGDGKPEKSFGTLEALKEHIYARARDFQQKHGETGPLTTRNWELVKWTFYAVNLALVLLLFGAIIVRRRLHRG